MNVITKVIKTFQKLSICVSILLASLLIVSPISNAADTTSSSVSLIKESAEAETILVPLYKSRIVQLHQPVKRISIGNIDIADILILRSNQLYIQGKDLGTTNVLMWDPKDNLIASLNIEVSHDLRSLKEKLYELLPNEDIKVHSSQGSLVLSGQVSSLAVMDIAMKIAGSFAALAGGDEEQVSLGATATNRRSLTIVNLMGVGGSHQVMLKVTVAEMSRDVTRDLGMRFDATYSGDLPNWSYGGAVNAGEGGVGSVDSIATTGIFANFVSNSFTFNAVLEASKTNGSTRILAEPTLTTLTGQEAKFLSGGEFQTSVRNDDENTVEFKEFGIGLKFLPVVLESGRINLKLNVSVSEPIAGLSPNEGTALSKREALSTVELADGQTIGIAGLISENMRDNVSKFPGLGDIPILGHLFRSSSFEKKETELVILVTPQLVKPINRDDITLPTDSYVEPNDLEFYLLGMNRGRTISDNDEALAEEETLVEEEGFEEEGLNEEDDRIDEAGLIYMDQPLPATGTGGVEESFGHSLEEN